MKGKRGLATDDGCLDSLISTYALPPIIATTWSSIRPLLLLVREARLSANQFINTA
jgi:hypothetical protein